MPTANLKKVTLPPPPPPTKKNVEFSNFETPPPPPPQKKKKKVSAYPKLHTKLALHWSWGNSGAPSAS